MVAKRVWLAMASKKTTDLISRTVVDRESNRFRSSNIKWFHGWIPIVILPGVVLTFVPEALPQWVFMWVLSFAIFIGCKWLTWRRTPMPNASFWMHAGYLFAWPGMDAAAFLSSSSPSKVDSCQLTEWLFAMAKFAIGISLFWGVASIVPQEYPLLVGWIGMIGIVMTLHFGLFHLLSCGWRTIGVDARPLMNWPLTSRSISEFWGIRWNTAFRDLTHRFLFLPLIPLMGARLTVLIAFLFSGLIHDLVISIPAGGGYGGPTLFFLVQGFAILLSRSTVGKKFGLRSGISGWCFTLLVLLLPICMLFHPIFVQDVIIPFMKTMEAIT